MQISVIGAGYVGLVTGVCFAELGFNIICVDKNLQKIDNLNKGIIPIYEPGLEELVQKNQTSGRIKFSTDIDGAVKSSDVVFVAVGTPENPQDGSADLSYVFEVAEEISTSLNENTVVVIKSTVPVGSGKKFRDKVMDINPDLGFHMVSNPEFLREGQAIKDFMQPDRVIIGAESDYAKQLMSKLYSPLANQGVPILFTDIPTAELTKYAANAFLATKIGFINEIADICEKVGANVEDVAKGMGLDKRIGEQFLKPGPGFGGSCFPKDTVALAKIAEECDAPSKIVSATINSNKYRRINMMNKISKVLGRVMKDKVVAVLGMAFKAGTDDVRESPAIAVTSELLKARVKIQAYDPQAIEGAEKALYEMMTGDDVTYSIKYCDSMYDAACGAQAIIILTEWQEFSTMDLVKIKNLMGIDRPAIVDLRNLLFPQKVKKAGFEYISVGRT